MPAQTRLRTALICLALAVVTLAVYWPALGHEFLAYDDAEYVTDNPQVQVGLTPQSLVWALTTGYFASWHPVTWLSHMLDCQLYGLKPAGHHLTSVLLHIANTLLLFLVLHAMTGKPWRSAFVAALFAIHPLHVESVAWVAERKDVLSTFFWLLTMGTYLRYTREPKTSRYFAVVILFALGLMAKPMVVTLPFVLLLLDYWPLERFRALSNLGTFLKGTRLLILFELVSRLNLILRPKSPPPVRFLSNASDLAKNLRENWKLVLEKMPLFLLAAASCVITFVVQQHSGAVAGTETLALPYRIGNALVAYVAYIAKMFWPSGLAVLYPHPRETLSLWSVGSAALVLVVVSFLALGIFRKARYPAVGWVWYLGTLLPVIGLVQVGSQAMADRYTYVPLIGLFIIIAWGVPDALPHGPTYRLVLGAVGLVVLVGLAVCTVFQLQYWRDSAALFEHTLAVTSNNYIAHNNLGSVLLRQGKAQEALEQFRDALAIRPNHESSIANAGLALVHLGRAEEAKRFFGEALRLRPDNAAAYNGLGMASNRQGETEDAIGYFRKALELEPDYVEAYVNLGNALVTAKRLDEAAQAFERVVTLRPTHAPAHLGLGLVALRKNDLGEAVQYFTRATACDPASPQAENSLGIALAAQGKTDEAIAHFRQALRLKPDYVNARLNLQRALQQKQGARPSTAPSSPPAG